MLCTIELNRSKPIASDPTSASFLKDMEDWGKICNHIYLWDYTVNFNHHISPFPNLHTLQPNIQLFVANNVQEHFQQSNTGTAHEFSELKCYMIAKLLWNPNSNTKEIIREFTDGYYGKAGKWIRKYIDALENEIIKTGERLDIYGPPTQHQHTFLSEKNIGQYNQYFDKAENAVSGQPEFLLDAGGQPGWRYNMLLWKSVKAICSEPGDGIMKRTANIFFARVWSICSNRFIKPASSVNRLWLTKQDSQPKILYFHQTVYRCTG